MQSQNAVTAYFLSISRYCLFGFAFQYFSYVRTAWKNISRMIPANTRRSSNVGSMLAADSDSTLNRHWRDPNFADLESVFYPGNTLFRKNRNGVLSNIPTPSIRLQQNVAAQRGKQCMRRSAKANSSNCLLSSSYTASQHHAPTLPWKANIKGSIN